MAEKHFKEEDAQDEELDDDELAKDKLAKEYERRAGDVTGWRPVRRPIRVRRGGPSHSFSVRFTPDELDVLQAQADAHDVTISEFIRSAALGAASSSSERPTPSFRVLREQVAALAKTVERIANSG